MRCNFVGAGEVDVKEVGANSNVECEKRSNGVLERRAVIRLDLFACNKS